MTISFVTFEDRIWEVANAEISCGPDVGTSATLELVNPKEAKTCNIYHNTLWDRISVFETLTSNFKSKPLVPKIKEVIFHDPATIVYWTDGTKTVVKKQKEDSRKKFDPEKGLAMAIAKKALGNEGNYFETIKKWTEK